MVKVPKKKQEALSVSRLINEVLVAQLSIPFRQIVNDTTFSKYTGTKRPDILISEFEYDGTNDTQYIENLVAYAEAKDDCVVDDKDWKDAIHQGQVKAPKLGLPYFIVTNCKSTYFYNAKTLKQLTLNGNPIREFQTIDIYRLIKNKLLSDPDTDSITTNVDSISTISEAIFNKKLWELAGVYRGINFKDNIQKIDFTVGFVALEYFEEKEEIDGNKDESKVYWSTCNDTIAEKIKNNLVGYINRLENETTFNEFKNVMEVVRVAINGDGKNKVLIDVEDVKQIYDIIDSMRPLHGTGFDLFGAVYEMFASSKEKKDFGEYFTRRHYAHIFAKLLLENEDIYNSNKEFSIIDPACGTGGFLTESFKVLFNNYEKSGTLSEDAKEFLSERCFYGVDVRDENISRARLNMFLVGDGHTHMYSDNTLKATKPKSKAVLRKTFQYVITNPPYGNGTIKANTTSLSSNRTEIAFICKVIDLLETGGKACVITPDGILENPSYREFRREIFEKCNVYAIISLPKFAFAPYTKEKTYALFLRKRSNKITKIQTDPVWMYIIDNDGLANSDKRYPTKLRNNRNGWMHDEISGWVSTDGVEMPGILESRWLKFDDSASATSWKDEKGNFHMARKGGNIDISTILNEQYLIMLPEYYLRPYEVPYIGVSELQKELCEVQEVFSTIDVSEIANSLATYTFEYKNFQKKGVHINECITYLSGSSDLKEERNYLRLQNKGEEYSLLTGATLQSSQTVIINAEDNVSRFEDMPGLLVTRKGKAGRTQFLPPGKYVINDDAYILYVMDSSPYDIDLKWLSLQYKAEFLAYSSSSDNGTWNMTGFFKQVIIDIPDIQEQKQFVSVYEKMEDAQRKITQLQDIFSEILTKQISIDPKANI